MRPLLTFAIPLKLYRYVWSQSISKSRYLFAMIHSIYSAYFVGSTVLCPSTRSASAYRGLFSDMHVSYVGVDSDSNSRCLNISCCGIKNPCQSNVVPYTPSWPRIQESIRPEQSNVVLLREMNRGCEFEIRAAQ